VKIILVKGKKLAMRRYRSILASILALVMVCLVSCGSPQAAKPPAYSPTQLEIVKQYEGNVLELRDRMDELEQFIVNRDWVNVGTFIHGPLGDLRRDMGYVSRNLSGKTKKTASQTAQDLFVDFEAIDAAADAGNYSLAVQNYAEAIKDFDAFLSLIPKG
jgi:photosystem II protein PsbQ